MRKSRQGAVALLLGFLATSLAGCANPDSTSGSSDGDPSQSSDQAHLVQACMADAGWDMELDDRDGSITGAAIPDSQIVHFQNDMEQCLQQNPLPELVISKENAEAYYDRLVNAGGCLKALGFEAPEPPSKEASVESMIAGNGIIDPLWDPYEPLFAGSVDAVAAARAMVECPRPEWGVH